MREVLTSDFEAANIQYIKFWVMDPFVDNPDSGGWRSLYKSWNMYLKIFYAILEKALRMDFRSSADCKKC
jgi:hypothetical protein